MRLRGEDAKYILETSKKLVAIGSWEIVNNRGLGATPVSFVARIAVAGVLPRGVWFRVKTIPQYPKSATFQLECDERGVRSRIPLLRLEWRPNRPHKNGPYGPPEWRNRFIEAGVTHCHSCLDHLDEGTGLIRVGGVQTARIIEPDFATYQDGLGWVCDTLKILNRGDIPPPPLQGEMF